MLFGDLPLNVFASEMSEKTIEVSSKDEFVSAFEKVKAAESGKFIISLQNDIVLSGGGYGTGLNVTAGKSVTLLGNGHTLTYGSDNESAQGSLTIGSERGELNLGRKDGSDSLTITTNNTLDHSDPLISLSGGGTINMYSGVVLTGNVNTSSDAGGVEVQNGTFNMYGGTISGCDSYFSTGGGVRVYGTGGKAEFNMYGGVIEDNKALKGIYNSYSSGGGVLAMGPDAEFNMYDGTIRNNEVSYRGGGVCSYMSNVTIKGGTISGNISGAGDHGNKGYGGGVCNYYGTMVIEGGVIENNKAINGGGICSYGVNYKEYTGTMDISNCVIKNNTAAEAGGVFSAYSNDVNVVGCTVSGNKSEDFGGGVYVYSGQMNMQGNNINGNTAVAGGGLMMESAEVSVDNGNVITDNEVSGENAAAGGIYFDNDGLSMSGKVVVQGNKLVNGTEKTENNVYFMYDETSGQTSYQTVNITGALTGSQIGVTEQGVMEGKAPSPAFTSEYSAFNPSVHPNSFFVSDDPDWIVLYSENNTEARLGKAVMVSYEWVGTAPESAVLPEPDATEPGKEYTAKEKPADTEEYEFSGWYTDKECTVLYKDGAVINEDTVLYGKWDLKATPVPPSSVAYRVEHYKENADGSYTLSETEFPLYGKIGETVNANEKEYEHYHVNEDKSVMSGIVTESSMNELGEPEILVLKVYYDMDTVTVSYDLNGGKGAVGVDYSSQTVKYGTSVTVKEAPAKDGFEFTGWKLNDDVYKWGNTINVTEDIIFTAQWRSVGDSSSSSDSNKEPPGMGTGNPQTGDSSNMVLWFVLIGVSAAGLYSTLRRLSEKRK